MKSFGLAARAADEKNILKIDFYSLYLQANLAISMSQRGNKPSSECLRIKLTVYKLKLLYV